MQGSQYQRATLAHQFQPQNQYQQQACGSTENLAPFNMQANFSNVQGCEEFQPRGTTRVVYSDGRCATFTSTNGNFPNCTIEGAVTVAENNSLTYQQPQQSSFQNNKSFRQQTPMFRNDYFVQQNYVHRPQGQVHRFIQGSKMRSNVSFRHFGTQNQNRRFKPKHFNYKMQKALGFCPSENSQQHDMQDCQQHHHCQVQKGFVATKFANNVACGMDSENLMDHGESEKKSKEKKSVAIHLKPTKGGQATFNKNNKGRRSDPKLLVPKVEVDYSSPGRSPHNLSYDDISENSDDNEDSVEDLHEQLLRKQQELRAIVKREPGEIDSEDDGMLLNENTSEKTTPKSETGKIRTKKKAEEEVAKKKCTSTSASSSKAESRKRKKQKKERSNSSPRSYRPAYSCHDDRCADDSVGVRGGLDEVEQTREGYANFCRSSSSPCSNAGQESSKVYYCPEAEVNELREKIGKMKESLRETQDQLLETRVIESKKSLRLQSEMDQLKTQLADKEKVESELTISLKKAEDELSGKAAELAKVASMYEAEKQEKAKYRADLSRTYQDRLTIETEKLRALFDVEVAKMQAYYISHRRLGYDETSYYRTASENVPMTLMTDSTNQVNDESVTHGDTRSSAVGHVDNSQENFSQAYYNPSSPSYFEDASGRSSNLFESELQGQGHPRLSTSTSTGYCSGINRSCTTNNFNVVSDTDSRISGSSCSAFAFFGRLASPGNINSASMSEPTKNNL